MKGAISTILSVGLAIACFDSPAIGAAAPAFPGVEQPGAVIWTLPTEFDSPGVVDVTLTVTGFEAAPVETGYVLRISGQVASLKPGAPDVPVVARVIPGVAGRTAHVRLVKAEPQEFADVYLAPAESRVRDETDPEKPVLKAVRSGSPGDYSSDAFWPPELVAVQEALMGTQKFVRIECHPIRYNPVSRVVRFYPQIQAELWFEPEEQP